MIGVGGINVCELNFYFVSSFVQYFGDGQVIIVIIFGFIKNVYNLVGGVKQLVEGCEKGKVCLFY